jgi:hypothetical protein
MEQGRSEFPALFHFYFKMSSEELPKTDENPAVDACCHDIVAMFYDRRIDYGKQAKILIGLLSIAFDRLEEQHGEEAARDYLEYIIRCLSYGLRIDFAIVSRPQSVADN